MKMALGNGRMTVKALRQEAKDRKEWRDLVHMYRFIFTRPFLFSSCFLSDRPPALWWLINPVEV